jgi:hypothetical protein
MLAFKTTLSIDVLEECTFRRAKSREKASLSVANGQKCQSTTGEGKKAELKGNAMIGAGNPNVGVHKFGQTFGG